MTRVGVFGFVHHRSALCVSIPFCGACFVVLVVSKPLCWCGFVVFVTLVCFLLEDQHHEYSFSCP